MNWISMALLMLLTAPIAALAAEDAPGESVEIAYREQVKNFWGEREATLHFVVSAKEAFAGELNWSLHAAGRTLISRNSAIEVVAGGQTDVEVRYTLPAVKDAVVYPIELRVWTGAKGKAPTAELRDTVYLFGANPFADRAEWLKSLKIHLFDPEDKTADAFEKLEVPFGRVTNLAAIDDLHEEVLIIGEDVEWKDYGELGPMLLSAAARGVSVLCLASADAELALPAVKQGEPGVVTRLSFRQTDVIHDFDKRLSLQWTGEHAAIYRSLALVAENDQVLARAAEPESGWPWMEVRFAQRDNQSSALVWCGLGLIRSWEESPTPRYLLLNWLEKSAQHKDQGQKER